MKPLQRQGSVARCGPIRVRLAAGDPTFRDALHLIRCHECRAFRREVERQRQDLEAVMDVTPSAELKRRTMGGLTEEQNQEG